MCVGKWLPVSLLKKCESNWQLLCVENGIRLSSSWKRWIQIKLVLWRAAPTFCITTDIWTRCVSERNHFLYSWALFMAANVGGPSFHYPVAVLGHTSTFFWLHVTHSYIDVPVKKRQAMCNFVKFLAVSDSTCSGKKLSFEKRIYFHFAKCRNMWIREIFFSKGTVRNW